MISGTARSARRNPRQVEKHSPVGRFVLGCLLGLSTALAPTAAAAGEVRIAAGVYKWMAVDAGGRAWTWGMPFRGNGEGLVLQDPAPTLGIGEVIQMAGGAGDGRDYVLALRADGTVWGWGCNRKGVLGRPLSSASGCDGEDWVDQPVRIEGLTEVASIAAGNLHGLALRADGTVWIWGAENSGSNWPGRTPIQVNLGRKIVQISANYDVHLALAADGTVQRFLGRHTQPPDSVSNLDRVIAVARGYGFSLALRADGTVWAFNYGPENDWCTGALSPSGVMREVLGLGEVVSIAAGMNVALAVKSDGTVWLWGNRTSPMCGNDSRVPRMVPGLAAISAVATHFWDTAAVGANGKVWYWGQSRSHEVCSPQEAAIPAPVEGYASAAGGQLHSLALKAPGGTARGSGFNFLGQLGDGTSVDRLVPTSLHALRGVRQLTAGGGAFHSLARAADSRVWAWGWDRFGQLGDGSPNEQTVTPGMVPGLSARQVGAGYFHSLAVGTDGSIWTWGRGAYGQLGNLIDDPPADPADMSPSVADSSSPYKLSLTDAVTVTGGARHSLALLADGAACSWGGNEFGQLGSGGTTSRNFWRFVGNLSEVVALAAGQNHSLALRADGTVWSWGSNLNGQLGDGTTLQRTLPVQVEGLSGVKAIAAGGQHSLALKADGTVWAWGSDYQGQLGIGGDGIRWPSASPGSMRTVPSQVLYPSGEALTGVVTISAGSFHSLAVKADGTLWTWGLNNYGQLADGSQQMRIQPVPVAPDDASASTATGTSVAVRPADPVTGLSPAEITFQNVTTAGTTALVRYENSTPPVGFRLGNPASGYEIATSAEYDGSITVCLSYAGTSVADELNLRLLHYWNRATCSGRPVGVDSAFDYSDSGWEDVTSSGSPDTTADVICGVVTCLSPFLVAEPLEIQAPSSPIAVGTVIQLNAPHNGETAALWDFGDGTWAAGTTSSDGKHWTATHSYASAGVYEIKLRLLDTSEMTVGSAVHAYTVVYDPSAGFATGGGWIESPAGAYLPAPTLSGKATFGFVARYQKGKDVPSGATEFQFRTAGLEFHSDTYDWLVVAGAKAQYKGRGLVNGVGGYAFMLQAIDAGLDDSNASLRDRLRIRIWGEDDAGLETVLYDNALGDDTDLGATEIAGGTIVIHR